jgi:hypothetical protein
MRKINTKEEALELANKIADYANSEEFAPFSVETDFKQTRTTKQNRYYFGVVVKMQYEYFANDLVKFMEWLFKVLQHSLTTELIHEVNKIIYNASKSSTRLQVDEFINNFVNPIREDMLHLCGIDIPLPEDEELRRIWQETLESNKGR